MVIMRAIVGAIALVTTMETVVPTNMISAELLFYPNSSNFPTSLLFVTNSSRSNFTKLLSVIRHIFYSNVIIQHVRIN